MEIKQLTDKEKHEEALATVPEEPTAELATADGMADMFGTPEITQGMLPPQITILKDAAMFEYGGEQFKSLTGHILFVQRHNAHYPEEYDPNDQIGRASCRERV